MQNSSLREVASAVLVAAAVAAAGCRSLDTGRGADPVIRGAEGLAAVVAGADVVFVGEFHDDAAHHAYQLELLKMVTAAAERDHGPAMLGMEMFQRPFQRHLDDYVAGRIDEREMLRRTEYIDRWRFDFTLYAPLWRFCRERGVRIVALNAEASIVSAVGRAGLDALSDSQRAQIADEIDLDVASHRARVMDVFRSGAHAMQDDALESMYAAMTVWDETMAETAARALVAAGPGAHMLVIAGSQHIQEYTGIPDRMMRRVPKATRVVVALRTESPEPPAAGEVPDAAPAPDVEAGQTGQTEQTGQTGHAEQVAEAEHVEQVEPKLGDFVVWLRPVDAPPRRLMGVMLANDPLPGGLLVESVVDGSNAARAGLHAGDVIHRVDRAPITDMVDLRYVLGLTPMGGAVVVEVLRDGAPLRLPLTFAPPAPSPEG